jgi:phosphoglucosamine mutase
VIDQGDYDFGLMITASHNPSRYNGIKLFQGNGEKPPDLLEKQIEGKFFSLAFPDSGDQDRAPVSARNVHDQAMEIYEKFLLRCAGDADLSGFKLVLDCAHGATYRIAPKIFGSIGRISRIINHQPDGRNINKNCGSTDLRDLKVSVLEAGADLGIAFDGDGDRVMFVDREGFILDGDYALFLIARYLKMNQGLSGNRVVGTIMSNMGLEAALALEGFELLRTDVGDKNVYRELVEKDSEIGGEKSGHIILKSLQKTGDGILTAIYFLKSLSYFQLKAHGVKELITPYAQESRNIVVREKRTLGDWEELNQMIARFNREFGDYSRVVIRYSGTEPVLRVMMESKYQDVLDKNLDSFVELIESGIGERNETGSQH